MGSAPEFRHYNAHLALHAQLAGAGNASTPQNVSAGFATGA